MDLKSGKILSDEEVKARSHEEPNSFHRDGCFRCPDARRISQEEDRYDHSPFAPERHAYP